MWNLETKLMNIQLETRLKDLEFWKANKEHKIEALNHDMPLVSTLFLILDSL